MWVGPDGFVEVPPDNNDRRLWEKVEEALRLKVVWSARQGHSARGAILKHYPKYVSRVVEVKYRDPLSIS